MEIISINNLCKKLISLAIQRCRFSGDPCRISVVFRRSTLSDIAVTQISISDTGAGSCLKEFQDLKYTHNRLSAAEWDGMLSITTTKLVSQFADHQGLKSANVALATELTSPSSESSNLEHLTSGLEDFVYKHGDCLSGKCNSCFLSRDSLKVGCGQACAKKKLNDTLVAEAVIIISESLEPSSPSCLKAIEPKTEVVYFRDFSPCSIHQSALKALRSIKWTSYGLTLKSTADDEAGLLEWENFPPNSHIDIVLHCYNNQVVVPPFKQRSKVETKLMKQAIGLALDDLKERYSGVLLSAHAVKINTYAPDLARSIAGLILSSDDPNFRGKCLGLLGMHMGNIEGELVEECIKQKILSAIDISDRRHPGLNSRDDVQFLFGHEHNQEPENMWYEYEDGEEEECTLMDF